MQGFSSTSLSLLGRIRDQDPNAWRVFVDRYGDRIFGWCLSKGLSTHNAEEVSQNVLLKMAQVMATFEYDAKQSFRSWLRRITQNALIDYVREQAKAKGANRNLLDTQTLDGLEARQDLLERLNDAFDLELLELAMERVRLRVDSRRWRAWEMVAMEQVPADRVAAELQMKVPSVYSSRYQVQKLIVEEIEALERRNESS